MDILITITIGSLPGYIINDKSRMIRLVIDALA